MSVAALVVAPEPNEGFATGAAALAFISAAAVGIERAVEAFWTLIGRLKRYGDWWPLKDVTDAITDYENATNAALTTHLVAAGAVLKSAKEAAESAGAAANEITRIGDELEKLQPRLTRLQNEVANAEKLAPGSPRFVLLTGTAKEAVDTLKSVAESAGNFVPDAGKALKKTADDVAATLDQAADIVAAFKDNPSRKLMSLLLGAIAGVAIAGLMGLNLFSAVLDDPSGDDDDGEVLLAAAAAAAAQGGDDDGGACKGVAGCLDNAWGILLTGVIVGLGANPTHEVIRALQRRKDDGTQTAEVPVVGAEPFVEAERLSLLTSQARMAPRQLRAAPTRTIRMTD